MLNYSIWKIFSKVMKSCEIMPGGNPEPSDVFRLRKRTCSITRSGERLVQKLSLLSITCSTFMKCLCKPGYVCEFEAQSEDTSTLMPGNDSDSKLQSMTTCGFHQGGAANLQCTQLLIILNKFQPSSCTASKCKGFGHSDIG